MYEIYTTAPDSNGRLDKEMRVYQLLNQLDIPYERVDHEAAMTMEACEEIDCHLVLPCAKIFSFAICQKTQFYLLLMPGEKKFLTKDFSQTTWSFPSFLC